METTTSMRADHFDLHIQKSFSFSAFKESTLAFFSDDDDDENDNQNCTNDINMTDENSFIEIALDNNKSSFTPLNNDVVTSSQDDVVGSDHLRISFSSSFPSIPETAHDHDDHRPVNRPVIQMVSSTSSSSSSLSSSVRLSASSLRSSSEGTAASSIFPGSESFSLYESSRRREHLPAFNPLVHTLLFSLEAPAPVVPATAVVPEGVDRDRNVDGGDHRDHDHDHAHRRRDWRGNNLQLAMVNADMINRKGSNVTPTTSNGGNNNNQNGIMKLLMIKFRATKVRKLFSSLFTKSRGQVNYLCNPNKLENDISYSKRSIPYYSAKEKTHIEYYDHHHHHDNIGTCYDSFGTTNDTKKCSSHDKQRRRLGDYKPIRALDVNLGAVRGVLEAMNMSSSGARATAGGGRNRRKTSSCPSSIKSSPIHLGLGDAGGAVYAGENSIQAAIAHCKSSLGQPSEFRF